jgi:PKD repeat protein
LILFYTAIHAQTVDPSGIPGISLWLSSDSSEVVNDSVVTWFDLSGNNNNAVQPDPTKRPLLIQNDPILNNQPVLYFDGNNDFLQFSNISDIKTIILLFNHDPVFRARDNIFGHTTNAAGSLLSGGLYKLIYYSANWLNIAFLNGISISPYDLEQDSVYRIVTLMPSPDGVANTISHIGYDSYYPWLGKVAEVLIYNRQLLPAERQSVERYLNDKYAPPVNFIVDTLIVSYGFCTTLSAGGFFNSYEWSTGEITESIFVNQSGTYSVEVNNYFGFLSEDSVNVVFPNVELNVSDTTICLGDSIWVETLLTSTDHYSFQWSTGDTLPGIYIKSSGNYYVVVTDTICGSDSSNVIHISIDSFSEEVSLGNDTALCSGDEISIVGPVINFVPLIFNWQDGSSDSLLTVVSGGTYSVTVTNQNGCVGVDTIQISISGNAPQPDFIADTVCLGQTTSFNNLTPGAIDSCFWDFGNGESSDSINPVFEFSNGGNFNVALSVYDGVCSKTIQKNVVVKSVPVAEFYSFQSCLNFPSSFVNNSNVPPPDSITSWYWDFGDFSSSWIENPTHIYSSAGEYQVTLIVESSNLCKDTVSKQTTVVSSASLPVKSELLTPFYNAVVGNGEEVFSWNLFPNAVKYRIILSSDDNLTDTLTSIYSVNTSEMLNLTLISYDTIFWKVIGYNICDDTVSSDIWRIIKFNNSSISGMTLWLSADSVHVNGTFVDIWYDKSGNGNHAIQTNSDFCPTLRPNNMSITNQPSIEFDGINDYMVYNEINDIKTSFFVYNHDSVYRTRDNLIGHTSNISGSLLSGGVNNLIYYSANWLNIAYLNFNAFNPYNLVQDSIYSILTLLPSPDGVANTISHSGYDGYNPWHGKIAEVMFFNTELDEPSRNIINQYLRYKYSPPICLGQDIYKEYGFCDTTVHAGERFVSFLWDNSSTGENVNVTQNGSYAVTVTDIFGLNSSDSLNVFYPDVSLVSGDTVICLGDSVMLQTKLCNTEHYSFLWSTGDTLPFIYVKYSGAYSVLVTDTLCGSRSSNSISVTVSNYENEMSLGNDTTLCSGNYITLQGGNNETVSYEWNDGSTSTNLMVLDSGTYSVITTSINACTATDSIYVHIHGTAPTAMFTAQNQCFGDSLVLTDASFANDLSNINQWEWTFHDNTALTGAEVKKLYAAPGIYPVNLEIATDSSCSASVTLQVQVHYLPEPAFEWSNPCSDKPIQFINTTQVLGGANVSDYLWVVNGVDSFDVAAPLYLAGAPGTVPVYLSATSNYGCVKDTVLTMEIKLSPVAQFDISPSCTYQKTYFFDQSVSPVYHPIIQWSWDLGLQGVSSSYQNPEYTYYLPGNYDVSLTVKCLNGCSDEYVRTIQVSSTPQAGITGNEGCAGTPIMLTDTSVVNNGYVFSRKWTIENNGIYSDSMVNLVFADSGHYAFTLDVVSELNCKSQLNGIITIHPLPFASFSASSYLGSAPFNVTFSNLSDEGLYLWDFGDGYTSDLLNPVHSFSDTGTYAVNLLVTDSNGCLMDFVSNIRVVPSLYDIAILGMDTIVNGNIRNIALILANIGTLPVENPYIIVTLPNSQPFTETVNLTLPPGTIHYYIMTTGILASDIIDRSFVCAKITLPALYGIEENQSNNEYCLATPGDFSLLRIYPNPASNQIIIEVSSENSGQAEMLIQSPAGRRVATEEITVSKGLNRIYLDISDYAQGMYFVSFTSGDVRVFGKFVKSGGTQ